MSVLTDATIISVSERRGVVNVYVDGKSYQIQPVTEIMSSVNQLVSTLPDHAFLTRPLSFAPYGARVGRLRHACRYHEHLLELRDHGAGQGGASELHRQARQPGEGLVQMQLEQLAGAGMETEYSLMIRDYAADASEENAERVRQVFSSMSAQDLTSPSKVAKALGFEDLDEDSVMSPLGLRTLSRVSVVRDGVAERIVDEYGSLQDLMDDIKNDPDRLGNFGVNNPAILADSLRADARQQARGLRPSGAGLCASLASHGAGAHGF